MTRRLRSLPLGVWLALGFALAVAAPTLSAGATWWAVGARQQADVAGRLREATVQIKQTRARLDEAGARRSLLRTLADLRIEADLQPSPQMVVGIGKPGVSELAPDAAVTKQALVEGGDAGKLPAFVTQALAATLQRPEGKR